MKKSIAKLRWEYGNEELAEAALDAHPLVQFERWFKESLNAKVFEPNGMTLATVNAAGRPSSRTVLLKNFNDRGFYFYTHYLSRKGKQLKQNPYASLTFWWKEIFRQVNIEGKVKRLSYSESSSYFHDRPKKAQIAVLASHQSTPLASRLQIDEAFDRLQKQFRGKQIPCPKTWGGYCLEPERIEFWQGRANRLHDRFLYVQVDAEWVLSRLAP